MTTVSSTFTEHGASDTLLVDQDETALISITGTFVATVELQVQKGTTWRGIRTFRSAGQHSVQAGLYRLVCVYVSGTVTYSLVSAGIPMVEYKDRAGNLLMRIAKEGVTFGDTEVTLPTARQESGIAEQVVATAGDALGTGVALAIGELDGTRIAVFDNVIDLTDLDDTSIEAFEVPAGCVILSVQANLEALVVAGGTTVKVALGLAAGDVDKYGITSTLVANQKINTIPDWAVLSAAEPIAICGVVTNGSALGSANITAGSVRVRVVYLTLAPLVDA